MEILKIEAYIDPRDQRQIEAARRFFLELGSVNTEVIQDEKPVAEKETTKKPEKETTKKPEKEITKKPEKEESKVVTIEVVRALLSKKVGNHRPEIKEKLTELGAPNVTNLEKEKYPEFMGYLKALK